MYIPKTVATPHPPKNTATIVIDLLISLFAGIDAAIYQSKMARNNIDREMNRIALKDLFSDYSLTAINPFP